MYCRAYFVLQRDFQELKNNNYEGITAFPVSEDMMKWEANIEGLQNTFWHRIFFQLTINFTPEYNFVPPVVTFRTIPFHPNGCLYTVHLHHGSILGIETLEKFFCQFDKNLSVILISTSLHTLDQHTGRPCIDFLDNTDEWNTSYTLSSILLTLQVMLSNPVLNNPVNLEAARMLTEDETKYKLIIRRLFHESLQLAKDDSSKSPEDSHKFVRSIKVSFDDYYKTWSEIATSKAAECYRTPLLEDPNFIEEYYKWKKRELQHPKEWNFKYAAIKARHARENNRPYKARYQTGRLHPCPTPNSQIETDIVTKMNETEEVGKSDGDDGDAHESWEEEVEGLVAWTNTLDTDTLDD
nr:PREDICTED: ubiquitin-conjugating enzyme E2 U isoform X1 [Rhinolophus sinicus]